MLADTPHLTSFKYLSRVEADLSKSSGAVWYTYYIWVSSASRE